jgi:hypothetical protein
VIPSCLASRGGSEEAARIVAGAGRESRGPTSTRRLDKYGAMCDHRRVSFLRRGAESAGFRNTINAELDVLGLVAALRWRAAQFAE